MQGRTAALAHYVQMETPAPDRIRAKLGISPG
jgi:hypothetical protein